MKNIVVFLADGFEECEGLASIDLLRRAGEHVVTASIMERRKITAAHQVVIMADEMAQDINFADVDMIVLPGGGVGTENLSKSEIVKEQCLAFAKDKIVGAICAAPTVLGGLGILQGKAATCYPGCEEGLIGARVTGDPVTVDGNIITGRGPGAAFDFALELIRQLEGEEKMQEIRQQIVY